MKQEILDHEISPSYKHVLGPFESTFKTFAADGGYPSLGTYDVGKQIVDLNFCRYTKSTKYWQRFFLIDFKIYYVFLSVGRFPHVASFMLSREYFMKLYDLQLCNHA